MLNKRRVLQLTVAAVLVISVAGCSTLGSDDPWTGNTGTVTGTVTSDTGTAVPDVEVCLWSETSNDTREVQYDVQTCEQGTFSFTDVDLGTVHSFAKTYELYVNCTKSCSTPINGDYATWSSTITVGADETCTVDVVLATCPDEPGDPDQYVGE